AAVEKAATPKPEMNRHKINGSYPIENPMPPSDNPRTAIPAVKQFFSPYLSTSAAEGIFPSIFAAANAPTMLPYWLVERLRILTSSGITGTIIPMEQPAARNVNVIGLIRGSS